MMRIRYNNKDISLIRCNSFFSKLKGFMFAKKIDKAIVMERCNSIHTFFMFSDIDVIMCDKDNNILYYYNNLKKNRIILPKRNVYRVFELPCSYFDIKINDVLEIIDK